MTGDEKTLLTNLAAGDEQSFNTLFEMYRDKLFHYLVKITKSPQVAEEMVTDIFVKLWVGRKLMNQVENVDGFLHKVAFNKAIDFLRTASRHARLQQAYIDRIEKIPEKLADEIIIDKESMQLLREAIGQLPPQRKLIYTLSREQGLTHDQIADALHLSRNTIKNSIMAATKSIKGFLQDNHADKGAISLLFLLV
jgi:RNA polymerase sigma-70 factor (ECF subfamily)